MGLSWWGPDGRWYGTDGAYPEGVSAAHTAERADEAMLRGHLIALGGITMVGAPVAKLGDLLTELGDLSPVPLPSRLDAGHVRVQDLTRRLAEFGNSGICD
ncbi:MAG: hypothetical protein LC799_35470, partial [Actinobacteria bacterium]|nr:hypothetical protein [Actinomycetota bacterium]